MAYEVVRADSFERDYDEAIGYLVVRLSSPSAARRLMDEIEGVQTLLSEAPLINAVSCKAKLARFELREHYVLNYVIVYRFDGASVQLIRLFHQSQAYDSPLYDVS